MRNLASILSICGKCLFVLGFLVVCAFGTATEIPLHGIGLPACMAGAVLLVIARVVAADRMNRPAGIALHFAAVAAYFGCRAFFSPVRHLGEMDLLLVAGACCAFLAGRSTGSVRWLLPWVAVIAVAGLAVSLVQVRQSPQFSLLAPLGLGRPPAARYASGFFFHYNPYGGWSALLLCLFLAALLGGGRNWSLRLASILGLAAAAIGAVLSYSRAGFLGTATGAAAIFLLSFVVLSRWRAKSSTKLLAFFVGVAITVAAVVLVFHWVDVLAAKRQTGTDLGALSDNFGDRSAYWRTGLSQFLQSKWIGGGGRSYSYLSYEFWEIVDNAPVDPYYAHNEYVQVLADYGFVGLVLMVGLLLHLNIRAVRMALVTGGRDSSRSGRTKVAACLAVSGMTLASAADSFFSFNLHFAPPLLLLGFLVGVFSTQSEPGFEPRSASSPWHRAGLAVATGLLLVMSLPTLVPGCGYALATLRFLANDADFLHKKIDTAKHLDRTIEIASGFSRYPSMIKAAETLLARAAAQENSAEQRAALGQQAVVWLDQALQVFPRSAEALLLRGHAQWAVGRYAQAEADFLAAAEIARFRESAYRCLSRLGELRYRRALEFWGNGDTESTCRLLAAALDAYDESNKRSRLNREGQAGRRLVAEMIDLLKRTKEWKEP